MSNMPELVKLEREKRGLSQSEFAKAVDRDTRTIQNWESGKSSPPKNMLRTVFSDEYLDEALEICSSKNKKEEIRNLYKKAANVKSHGIYDVGDGFFIELYSEPYYDWNEEREITLQYGMLWHETEKYRMELPCVPEHAEMWTDERTRGMSKEEVLLAIFSVGMDEHKEDYRRLMEHFRQG